MQTSEITISMHCWRPLHAELSALDIAAVISSQEEACAPSTGKRSLEIDLAKYYNPVKSAFKLSYIYIIK